MQTYQSSRGHAHRQPTPSYHQELHYPPHYSQERGYVGPNPHYYYPPQHDYAVQTSGESYIWAGASKAGQLADFLLRIGSNGLQAASALCSILG
ncbi:unnamed protein product [Didymodactylos carnosus]|uniref:Uncharacterized protein n=1 Tax=Didymodactylos carnosus TaxID=1234261 RepID=A0A814MDA7_9BILA|nr:unnamed protein product [Didymodactylos carnosus]CAF1077658.1 unnamed protein product [Didymodactylos carnosus]CAF3659955.1 unnamed protein product [Didymodactylos carnosus]CAF3843952.1 unnamed protein product [Didymodactylos carnosus]